MRFIVNYEKLVARSNVIRERRYEKGKQKEKQKKKLNELRATGIFFHTEWKAYSIFPISSDDAWL